MARPLGELSALPTERVILRSAFCICAIGTLPLPRTNGTKITRHFSTTFLLYKCVRNVYNYSGAKFYKKI